MKKLFVAMFAVGMLVATPAFAQMGMMGSYTNNPALKQASDAAITASLQDITKSQNISDLNQVVCSKVTDDQFDKLGDVYMGYGITETQHTAMENMMGGEGSATLKAAHINIGRAYLGCWAGYSSGPIAMPMMSSYYGSAPTSGFGMMGYYGGYSWFGGITMVLVWVLLALGIVALVQWLRKNRKVD